MFWHNYSLNFISDHIFYLDYFNIFPVFYFRKLVNFVSISTPINVPICTSRHCIYILIKLNWFLKVVWKNVTLIKLLFHNNAKYSNFVIKTYEKVCCWNAWKMVHANARYPILDIISITYGRRQKISYSRETQISVIEWIKKVQLIFLKACWDCINWSILRCLW